LRKIRKRSRIPSNDTPEISIVNGEVVTAPAAEPEPLEHLEPKPFLKSNDDEIPVFGKDETDAVFDTLTMIQSAAASKIYSVPSEITRKAMEYDEFHRKKLALRMERLLNKWAPMLIKTWKDEIGFGIVFVAVVNSQVKTMHAMNEKRKRAIGRPGVTEMPKPSEPPKPEPKTEPEAKPAATEEIDELDSVGIPGL
jgi:hypothetical protein